MTITLRPIRPMDHRFVHELNRLAYEDLAVRIFGSWEEEPQRTRFAAKLASGSYRIVEVSGEPVGAVCTTEFEDHFFVNDLMVLPRFQHQGIGSYVLRAEIARASQAEKPLRLHTSRQSDAHQFYRKLGFREIGGDDEFLDFERRD